MNYPSFIYELRNKANGKIYIGITSNPYQRFHKHISDMKCGCHPVQLMNEDYSEYGAESFEFNVIDTVHSPDEARKEKYWQIKLRTREPEFGYNYKEESQHLKIKDISPDAESFIRWDEIHNARRKKKLSVNQLAKMCGVQASAVSKWENGRIKTLSYARVLMIATALDCSPTDLIRGE